MNITKKNHFKKFLLLLVALMIAITLVGCGDDDEEEPSNPTPTPPITPTDVIDQTKVTIYDGPSIMETSQLATVKVNNNSLFVYETRANTGRVFTFADTNIIKVPLVIFDFEGRVNMEVTIPGVDITSAKVTPASYNVQTTITDNKICFSLDYPTTYTVEYNNQSTNVVHIIANPLEEETIDPDNLPANIIYLGPGVYKTDTIPLTSNSTIYIAGGAVVYGSLRASYADNITIKGRGIISGEIYDRQTASEFTIPFELQHCNNVKLEGITFLDPAGWAINNYFVDGMTIDNIHIFTARANGDGISIQSCKNITIQNSFVRSWDDALVVKNYDMGTTDNIKFENITIWSDLAQSMEIGYECYGATINNVQFNNITVLHNFHKSAISIHNADQAAITNIKFTNITIEDAQMHGDNASSNEDDFFIDFNIQFNQEWTSSGGTRGTIDGVLVDNILVIAGDSNLITRINGYDDTHKVVNVQLNNIKYIGKEITSLSDLNYKSNAYNSNITTSYSYSTGAQLNLPYTVNITKPEQITIKPTISQTGLMVPEFVVGEITEAYMGVVVTGNFTANGTHGTGTQVWDDGTGEFSVASNPASNVLDGDSATYWQAGLWVKKANTEYAALNIDLDGAKKIGTIRIYGNQNSSIYQTQYIAVYGLKKDGTNFSKISGGIAYEFSPANGNLVDIKITPNEYEKIQLRIYYRSGIAYPEQAYIYDIKMYPASLSFGKAVMGTAHEDVYEITRLTDGFTDTYYESKKGVMPAEVTINMVSVYNIKYIVLNLPPYMQWEKRTQVITFQGSTDGQSFTNILTDVSCVFDPQTGNVVQVVLETPVSCQYLKLIIKSNTVSGGYGAQLSEISVYE